MMCNTNGYRLITSILNAFLWGEKITLPDEVDWKLLNSLADINSISGIVGFVLQQSGISVLPPEMQRKYDDDYNSTIAMSVIRDEAMKALMDQFDQQEIDRLLFKGYVVKDLYPVPELRTFGDIDFAIRPGDRSKSNHLMLSNGYRPADDWEPVYAYQNELEHYEIHTEIIDSDLGGQFKLQEYFRNFWSHSIKVDDHTYLLETGYHLLYLLAHLAKHLYGSGAGVRMYLDIAFFIREYRDEIDWEHFKREVSHLKMNRFVNTVFAAVQTWFHVPSPISIKAPKEGFLERFLEFTLNGGVFGFADRKGAEVELRQNMKNRKVNRTSTFMRRAFPSASTLAPRYTYLQSKPWLLPAAWVHRLFKKKNTTTAYLKETKAIFSADEAKLHQMRELYDIIGL